MNKVLCLKVPELLRDLWIICQFHLVRPKVDFASVHIDLKSKLKIQLQTQAINVGI